MKVSRLLASTLRETAQSTELRSHELMVRAGFIRQLGAGIFSYLHLGWRSIRKIEQILREEMDNIGGVEINMPVVHPADVWRKTGRYDEIDDSMVRFNDRAERDMVLAMTHEEVVSDLALSEISSYKQLPVLIYQMQTKFRDEPRSRGGLIRVREFIMKDSYSLDTSWEGLEKQYDNHYWAYYRIFKRAGLPVIAIKSDVGMMGGKVAHEYMYVSEIGEDTIFICEKTGYKANKEVATFRKTFPQREAAATEKVHTPGTKTIKDLAAFLNIEESDTGKMVFMTGKVEGEEKLIAAVVRGDMELNTVKLAKAGGIRDLEPATEEAIKAAGCVPGYASPIDIDREKCLVVVDDYIANTNNLVLGANEVDYHLKNVCCGRDYEADIVADIVSAYEGAPAPDSEDDSATLTAVRGVEVGNIFQLGTKYTDGLGASFMDVDGRPKSIIMGSYGIGVGRMLACLAEQHQDEKGLMLPISIAPYHVALVGLMDNEEVTEQAEALYKQLQEAGVEVLFDDRGNKVATPGVKFGDADLIGLPIRLTISKRSLKNGGVEMKRRDEADSKIIAVEEVLATVQETIKQLYADLKTQVEASPYMDNVDV